MDNLDILKTRIRKQFLRDLVYRIPLSGTDLVSINEYYCLNLIPDAFNVLAIKTVSKKNSVSQSFIDEYLEKIDSLIHDFFSTIFYEFETYIEQNKLYFIFNITSHPDSEKTQDFKLSISRFFSEICSIRKYSSQIYVVMGEGIPVTDINHLSQSLDSAMHALEFGLVYGYNKKYDSNEHEIIMDDILSILTAENKIALQHALDAMNIEQTKNWIENIFNSGYRYFNTYPGIIFELCRQIIKFFIESLGEGWQTSEFIEKQTKLLFIEIDKCIGIEDIIACMQKNLIALLETHSDELKGKDNQRIYMIKKYIRENYSRDICLSDLAKHINLNPQYISYLFRIQNSTSFSQFLTRTRIDAAKLLLKEEKLNVQELCSLVGYEDSKYFSRVFKRTTGLTPSEFRKLHSKKTQGL